MSETDKTLKETEVISEKEGNGIDFKGEAILTFPFSARILC